MTILPPDEITVTVSTESYIIEAYPVRPGNNTVLYGTVPTAPSAVGLPNGTVYVQYIP